MKVRVTVRARRDLNQLVDYLNARSHLAADAVLLDIEAALAMIGAYPEAAPLTSETNVRAKLTTRYRYLIYYRIRSGNVDILRVRHGARTKQFLIQ